MIELSLIYKNPTSIYTDDMLLICEIITWMLGRLRERPNPVVGYHGHIILFDREKEKWNALIMCGEQTQKFILEILLQPPPAFKDKYVACVVSKEPCPVQQVKEHIDEDGEEKKEGEEASPAASAAAEET